MISLTDRTLPSSHILHHILTFISWPVCTACYGLEKWLKPKSILFCAITIKTGFGFRRYLKKHKEIKYHSYVYNIHTYVCIWRRCLQHFCVCRELIIELHACIFWLEARAGKLLFMYCWYVSVYVCCLRYLITCVYY